MSNKVQKPCRICGKMYTPCADCERDKTAFHWRTVACSRECAIEYFAKIEESRKIQSNDIKVAFEEPVIKTENEEMIEVVDFDFMVSEDIKSTKVRKKKNNEESEQID